MRVWLARVALAIVAALLAWMLVEVLNRADGNGARTEQLQRHLEATPPATADQVAELGEKVDALPSEIPTPRVVVTSVPGPAGRDGADGARGPQGAAGTTTVRTVTVPAKGAQRPAQSAQRPRPAPTATVTIEPVCIARVAGLCVSR